jgi:DNA-binding FadR family transcriptional regulator
MPRRKYDGPNRFGALSPSGAPSGARGRKLYVRIAESISDTLMAGRYSPGDRLPAERDLALHFGVSRPTMREALLALEIQGLVELRRSTGITVTLKGPHDAIVPDSDAGALALLQSRRLFEGEVAALAAINATTESVAELARALRALRDDTEASFRDLHVRIAQICANNVTIACIDNLWPAARDSDPHLHGRLAAAARLYPGAWAAAHEPILAAIAGRDPHAARAAMNTFSDLAIEHLRQAIKMPAMRPPPRIGSYGHATNAA